MRIRCSLLLLAAVIGLGAIIQPHKAGAAAGERPCGALGAMQAKSRPAKRAFVPPGKRSSRTTRIPK